MKRLFQKIPRILPVLVLLALFGLLRGPVEDRLREDLVSAKLLTPPPAQGAFEQMGQSALMGTLGGLRSLVATFMTLEAFDHFSTKSWDDLRQSYQIITALEPRDETHWVSVIWHLGINATANMEIDERLPSSASAASRNTPFKRSSSRSGASNSSRNRPPSASNSPRSIAKSSRTTAPPPASMAT